MKWFVTDGVVVTLVAKTREECLTMLLVETGDIITLNKRAPQWAHDKAFVVDEVRDWGVVCFTVTAQGSLYLRAKWDQIDGPMFTRVKQEEECRCDCASCAGGDHLGCYYTIDGIPECPIKRKGGYTK